MKFERNLNLESNLFRQAIGTREGQSMFVLFSSWDARNEGRKERIMVMLQADRQDKQTDLSNSRISHLGSLAPHPHLSERNSFLLVC